MLDRKESQSWRKMEMLIVGHEILSAADRIPLPRPLLRWADKQAPLGKVKPQVCGEDKRGSRKRSETLNLILGKDHA